MTERAVSDDIDITVPLREIEELRALVKEAQKALGASRLARVSWALRELSKNLDVILLEEEFKTLKEAVEDDEASQV